MADWPVLESKEVVSVDLAKVEFVLSREGFQLGMSRGDLGREIVEVGRILEEFSPELHQRLTASQQVFSVNVGLPGTNQKPEFRYLGVYINSIEFAPGSRKLNLTFAVMFHAVVSAAQGYPELRDGVVQFQQDVSNVLEYLNERFDRSDIIQGRPHSKIYEVRRPETVEKQAVQKMISGTRAGKEV